eukprot:9369525-Pyramimonas_sp.AAC.1
MELTRLKINDPRRLVRAGPGGSTAGLQRRGGPLIFSAVVAGCACRAGARRAVPRGARAAVLFA